MTTLAMANGLTVTAICHISTQRHEKGSNIGLYPKFLFSNIYTTLLVIVFSFSIKNNVCVVLNTSNLELYRKTKKKVYKNSETMKNGSNIWLMVQNITAD